MNTPVSKLQTVSVASWPSIRQSPSGRARRLVVVISDVTEEAGLASRIWPVAQARGLQVLLLGICPAIAQEPGLRRRLATIAAFLRVRDMPVEFTVDHRRDWLDVLKAGLNQDDEIACYVEDGTGICRGPLSDMLSRSLGIPVLDFSGLHSPEVTRPALVTQACAWLGSLLTIAGFFVLQAHIVDAVQAGTQTAVLLVTLFVEAGLIWFWNSLFS